MKKTATLITFLLVLPQISLGALKLSHSKSHSLPPLSNEELTSEMIHLDEGELKIMQAKAIERSKNRAPATSDIAGEDLLSEPFKQFRAKFLKVKSGDEIDALIQYLDSNYDTFPNDLKYVALHIIPLKSFKSIVFRMVPLFKKAKVTHSYLLTYVKQVAAGLRITLPTDQWSAGFEYITEPYENTKESFETEADLQNFLASEVYRHFLKANKRLNQLDLSKPIVGDNQLFYGVASFEDKVDRYRIIGQAEKFSEISASNLGLAWLTTFCAYHMDHFFEVANDLGNLYGIDGFKILNGVEGAPAKSRTQVLNKQKYATFLTLSESGAWWMKHAYSHLRTSIQFAELAWLEIKDKPINENTVINPGLFNAVSRQTELSIKNAKAILNGKAQISSAVTGELVTVNLPAFYNNPVRDLKSFLPIEFEESAEMKSKTIKTESGASKSVEYRNYFRGRAIGWNLDAYRNILPEVKNNNDLEHGMRTLAQSWGGNIIAASFLNLGL